jgi:hypothetical protein
MFQFPGFALVTLCIQVTSTWLTRLMTTMRSTTGYQVGFPIRTSRDQRVLSPPPGLSQSATSFIASCRQGIHQTPFSRLIRPGSRKTTGSRRGGRSHPWSVALTWKDKRSMRIVFSHALLHDVNETIKVLTNNPRARPARMVERVGIEPTTPCLQSRCSPS